MSPITLPIDPLTLPRLFPQDELHVTYFPEEQNLDRVAQRARETLACAGTRVLGGLYHITDGGPRPRADVLDFGDADFDARLAAKLARDAALGCEYITFQVHLPPRHADTGGEYRSDTRYIEQTATRLAQLQHACHRAGLNFYVETHIERVSEDLAAFAAMLALAPPMEVNADISHLNYRGITRGAAVETVLSRAGHMHQRMARRFGDLSAAVPDPHTDWSTRGLTYQAWQSAQRALAGGLSSRTICGEAGPIHLVQDALGEDAALVPLWRKMARHADALARAAEPDVALDNPFAQPAASSVTGEAGET